LTHNKDKTFQDIFLLSMPIKFYMGFTSRLQFIYQSLKYLYKKTFVFSHKLQVMSDMEWLRNITPTILEVFNVVENNAVINRSYDLKD